MAPYGVARRSWLPAWLRRYAQDRVAIRLPGLDIAVERRRPPFPAELTVVVPRAELRARMKSHDGSEASIEVIVNSITVAHSPRHPAAAPPAAGPLPSAVEVPPQTTAPSPIRESRTAGS